MEIYIDDQKITGIKSFDVGMEEQEQTSSIGSLLNKEISLTMESVETNIRLMSDKSRLWCKQIKRDGKIYW